MIATSVRPASLNYYGARRLVGSNTIFVRCGARRYSVEIRIHDEGPRGEPIQPTVGRAYPTSDPGNVAKRALAWDSDAGLEARAVACEAIGLSPDLLVGWLPGRCPLCR